MEQMQGGGGNILKSLMTRVQTLVYEFSERTPLYTCIVVCVHRCNRTGMVYALSPCKCPLFRSLGGSSLPIAWHTDRRNIERLGIIAVIVAHCGGIAIDALERANWRKQAHGDSTLNQHDGAALELLVSLRTIPT